ncbi:hypothetical protein [Chromobacterium alticapitis]|nr:hypothetical protein [Chromobacterium alticapitis]
MKASMDIRCARWHTAQNRSAKGYQAIDACHRRRLGNIVPRRGMTN